MKRYEVFGGGPESLASQGFPACGATSAYGFEEIVRLNNEGALAKESIQKPGFPAQTWSHTRPPAGS